MDGEGYIRLYWRTKDSIAGSSAVSLGIWSHLLMSVSVRRRTLSSGVVIEPGQVLLSVAKLSQRLDVSRKVIDRLLRVWESEQMISVTKRDRNGTLISVCNWKTYQPQWYEDGNAKGTQGERNGNETSALQRNLKNQKPTSPPTPHGETGDDVAGWLAGELRERGAFDADAAVQTALERGVAPSDIEAAIAHFDEKRGAWNAAGLVYRVKIAQPGMSAEDGWPEPSRVYERQQAREKASQPSRDERRRADAAREAEEASNALERKYGPLVDAMPRAEAEAIARAALGGMAARAIREWPEGRACRGAIRVVLISHVRNQNEGAS